MYPNSTQHSSLEVDSRTAGQDTSRASEELEGSLLCWKNLPLAPAWALQRK